MKPKPTYDFISNRMKSSGTPDKNDLWKDMSQILDRHMPERKEKERKFLVSFSRTSGAILACVFIALILIYFVATPDLSRSTGVTSMPKTNTASIEEDKTNNSFDSKSEPVQSIPKDQRSNSNNRLKESTDSEVQHEYVRDTKKYLGPEVIMNELPSKNRKFNQATESDGTLANNFNYRKLTVNKSTTGIKLNHSVTAKDLVNAVSANSMKIQNHSVYSTKPAIQSLPEINKLSISSYPQQDRFVRPNIVPGNLLPRVDLVDNSKVNETAKWSQNKRGFTTGLALNLNLPLSSQEMSNVNINGKKKSMPDYIPSVFVQYHFNDKLFLESELQVISPQFTPQMVLASKRFDNTTNQFKESKVSLNKLYYLNVPVSVHYSPIKNLFAGAGIQYSYLRRSVLIEEITQWKKTGNDWNITEVSKTVKVKSNPNSERKEHQNNGRGPNQQPMTLVDTIAQSFRSSDWRLLLNASYNWKRFNLGLNFNIGINNYIETNVNGNPIPVQDRNKSIQFYLRYNILDLRKAIRK